MLMKKKLSGSFVILVKIFGILLFTTIFCLDFLLIYVSITGHLWMVFVPRKMLLFQFLKMTIKFSLCSVLLMCVCVFDVYTYNCTICIYCVYILYICIYCIYCVCIYIYCIYVCVCHLKFCPVLCSHS